MKISIVAEKVFEIGNFPVTNTLLASWVAILILTIFAAISYRAIKKGGKFTAFLHIVFEAFIDFMASFAGSKETVKKYLPFVGTIFFYILISNWVGTLPGVETIGLHKEGEFVPLLRTANSDINMTLALAVILVVSTHVVGIKNIGFKHHVGKFLVNPFTKPIGFFVGILELIGEVSRVVSLTFRLFGNIFAGSVLMLIISLLAPYIVPIPFLGLELFVGFIQALVFSVLAMMFLTSATQLHEEH
ncbi:MAG: F0F1 ATP synthase subunit A [Candidatus Paceibacterota bacterium]